MSTWAHFYPILFFSTFIQKESRLCKNVFKRSQQTLQKHEVLKEPAEGFEHGRHYGAPAAAGGSRR